MTNALLYKLLDAMWNAEHADYYYTTARIRDELACRMSVVYDLRQYALAHGLIRTGLDPRKYVLTPKGTAIAKGPAPTHVVALTPVPAAKRVSLAPRLGRPTHTQEIASLRTEIEALRAEISELRMLVFGLEDN